MLKLRIVAAGWILVVSSLVGCKVSTSGSVVELVKTRTPTFGGSESRVYLSPSTTFVLTGECDRISFGLFYSYDRSNWIEIPEGCPENRFSLTINFNREIKVYVRSRLKNGEYTPEAVATIRLILPPTSPFMKLTNSGRADDEMSPNSGQNEMGSISANTLANTFNVIKTSLVDIIYGP